MTILQSISTFLIIILFGSYQNLWTETNPTRIIQQLQGTWVHSEDASAKVKISEDSWTFCYEGESTLTDYYKINIIDSLPKYVDPKNNSEFLILTNQTDTLEYEIFGLNNTILRLMYFPRGNIHVYEKENK